MSPLPPAPAGTVYRHCVLNGDKYITTGTFEPSAPDRTLKHLVSAPVLILDCDLADFELPKGTKDEIDARKAVLRALPQAELDTRIEPLAPRIAEVVTQICGAPPTRIVTSGYGVHVYLWLTEADSLRVADVRRANKALLVLVNEVAGFKLADTAVHDAGTRVLRIPDTMNTKNPAMPRPVVELHRADTTHDLERWLTVAPAKASTPAPAKASTPAPAKAVAPAKAETAPAETSDPFAAAYARPHAALAWMLAECPFFLWAQAHPQEVGRASWRGAATNIAFLMGEGGRETFRTFSALDPVRYDAPACDQLYTDAIKSAEQGAVKYTTLLESGDWPGPVPEGEASPALRARAEVRPAPPTVSAVAKANPPDPERLRRNKHGIVVSIFNLCALVEDPRSGIDLRLNVKTKQVEVGGHPYEEDSAVSVVRHLDHLWGVAFPLAWISPTLRELAKSREYHPTVERITSPAWDSESRTPLALTEVLGVEATALNLAYLRCFMVGAVARLLSKDPRGVKLDTVLILKGPQGVRKSKFFDVLSGGDFCESTIDVESKDGYIAIAQAWIIEWFEIDHALSRAQSSAIKGFLTAKVDTYRPPYGRTAISVPRRSVIVGTTNEDQFLRDATGSRRFHVIETTRQADVTLLESMRDQLWAEAVHLYRTGAQWWLTGEEEALRVDASDQYEMEEPWSSLVAEFIESHRLYEVTTDRILMECIQKKVADWKHADRTRIGYILKDLHFVPERVRVEGILTRIYKRPRPPGDTGDTTNVVRFPAVPAAPSHRPESEQVQRPRIAPRPPIAPRKPPPPQAEEV